LDGNPWEGAWKGIEKYTVQTVIEMSRQRAPIFIFISHSRKNEDQHIVKILTQDLKKRKEIREVYMRGEQEMYIQLFLFIATNNSITEVQCLRELELAITLDIPIIPIKESDLKWEELNNINLGKDFKLSDKLGLEFDIKDIKEFCDELYEHIKKYKRKFNLFEPAGIKIDEQWGNIKILIKEFIESNEFGENIKKKIDQFQKLSEELKSEKITPHMYILKCAQIIDSKSK